MLRALACTAAVALLPSAAPAAWPVSRPELTTQMLAEPVIGCVRHCRWTQRKASSVCSAQCGFRHPRFFRRNR